MPLPVKEVFYKNLVDRRRKYDFDNAAIQNPAVLFPNEADNHLNAWVRWHGCLDARIVLMGQNFGDVAYYQKFGGKDDPASVTNNRLATLFSELGIETGTSDAPNEAAKLYFTNAFLGTKKGRINGAIPKSLYAKTARKFIKPLLAIINPLVIIAMGAKAFEVMQII